MDERSKVLAVANDLANRVKGDKRPYSSLKWIVDCCDWQYQVTKSELIEAYFATINILKQDGVENVKRKPLTALTQQQRSAMRKQAKDLAATLEKFLGTPVEVTRMPIRTNSGGAASIQIAVKLGVKLSCDSYFYPTFEQLSEWSALQEPDKTTYLYQFAQQFKTIDQQIKDNIETIKAKLESSL